jgi:hypothetical protein
MSEFSGQYRQAAGGRRRTARIRFIFHHRSSQVDLIVLIFHRFLCRGLFPINRCEFCYHSVESEVLGVEKLDNLSLLDFPDLIEKYAKYATKTNNFGR